MVSEGKFHTGNLLKIPGNFIGAPIANTFNKADTFGDMRILPSY
jgi:hypothetical protein